MQYYIQILVVILLPVLLPAQAFDSLIHEAWKNNPAAQARNFELEAATAGISEAKALYGPTANFGIQYSLARGGRSINLPIGDLLNPVYATLNQLTQSQSFPQIANTKEQFLPDNFYDAKVRIMQPVYYPDLALNKMVQKNQAEIKNLKYAPSEDCSREISCRRLYNTIPRNMRLQSTHLRIHYFRKPKESTTV